MGMGGCVLVKNSLFFLKMGYCWDLDKYSVFSTISP